ncbi:tryptophan 7-halogenase [Fulvivirga maritima]|uniref:NAD(P)/FAD-dependent oxidoreductase n=1 Tax=Fulvivirga maritima TaxID=2904247 RepID=UPI001F210A31|nr:tryptophan 7-halogenase [Fulvivirga maritima]UII27336.1 tryptophan 7-halogenase [Fulvivirga maritima]
MEFGAVNKLFVPSHQIDRGIFENDLIGMISNLGVHVIMNSTVKEVDISEDCHTVTYQQGEDLHTIMASWVVDATGRASFLKRKLGLGKEIEHHINAAWFRIKGEVDISDWSVNPQWINYVAPGLRRLSTVHLMSKGYWVWLIPLSSGNTSIGIVADPRFHDFACFNKLEKAFEWLKQNEPQCANQLEGRLDDVLDFKVLKKFSYDSQLFYSTDKWAVVGESGAFLDPFYSPGTDFISMSNCWTADLILRDYQGEDVYTRTKVYDQVHARLFQNWIPIYFQKYELFGNTQVMAAKITWDFAFYWSVPSLVFTNKAFVNMNVLKELFTTKNSFGERLGKLNRNVQDFYLDWGRMENKEIKEIYLDPMSVPFMNDLQKGIEEIYPSDKELLMKLEKNLSLLEQMAAELFRVVSHQLLGTPEDMAVDPYMMSLKSGKNELMNQSNGSSAIPATPIIREALSVIWLESVVAK